MSPPLQTLLDVAEVCIGLALILFAPIMNLEFNLIIGWVLVCVGFYVDELGEEYGS